MKTTITLLVLGFNGFLAAGQCCPYINSVTVDPANPSSADNVRIFTTVTPPNAGGLIEHSFTVQNDTIFAEACYWTGMATVLIPIHDTIDVGPLPEGDYVLQFTAHESYQMEQCVVNESQVYLTTFSVGGTAGINDPEQTEAALYPNPAAEILNIAGKGLQTVRMSGADGKEVQVRIVSATPELLVLNVEALAKGCYFVEVKTENGTVSKRMVKD
jgi:hypothetical protein